MPGDNLTYMDSMGYTDIEVDYEGVSQFVNMLNTRLSKNTLQRRDGSNTNYTVDEMIALVGRTIGSKANRLSKREDCANKYWHNFTNTFLELTTFLDKRLLARWKQYARATAIRIFEVLTEIPFFNTILEIRRKYEVKKKICNGGFVWLNIDDGSDKLAYWVGYTHYELNDTYKQLSCDDVVTTVINYSVESIRKLDIAGFCTSFVHDSVGRIDVRVMRWEEKYANALYGWNIVCGSW
ncbi:hypothetical protein TPHA_0K02375 [Tetrapisispora phaffii CBS 4417]|uniref:Uncharacterized protein n=1 Tax=Tetrapisispora phaffii (strain ATCC 24235 / CBS 4417 / NBRC 1672 / NRRL Y-8282 / UCD 70-5) TaxID=1071381 RepID=G8BZP0_TETPH|nr:hypothetical protein TPHA_0K02375 [Tetrapisispora phaffii CBS 4417]CCE65368.1 hypothetical protein TPHA_0K02375 [Tetrapisispora phaffii CBS 4417]